MVLTDNWNASAEELREFIRLRYPQMDFGQVDELLEVALEVQQTERRKVDPSTVRVRPPEVEKKMRRMAPLVVADPFPVLDDELEELPPEPAELEEPPLEPLADPEPPPEPDPMKAAPPSAEAELVEEVVEEGSETVTEPAETPALLEVPIVIAAAPSTRTPGRPRKAELRTIPNLKAAPEELRHRIREVRDRVLGEPHASANRIREEVRRELQVDLKKEQADYLFYYKGVVLNGRSRKDHKPPAEPPKSEAPPNDSRPVASGAEPLVVAVDVPQAVAKSEQFVHLDRVHGEWRLRVDLSFPRLSDALNSAAELLAASLDPASSHV